MDTFETIVTNYRNGLDGIAAEMAQIAADRKSEKYPLSYTESLRLDAIRRAAALDADTHRALDAYRTEALRKARVLRAASDAGRDSTDRLADEMERSRLASGKLDADALVAQARDLLEAGQPRMAAVRLGAAEDKGARFTAEVWTAVEDAIDAIDPKRKEARQIEQEVEVNSALFDQSRLTALTSAGIGTHSDGSIGTGRSEEMARASVNAKVAAALTARESGIPYVEPTGVLSGMPNFEQPPVGTPEERAPQVS